MVETFRAAARSTVRLHCVTAKAVPFTELGCAFFNTYFAPGHCAGLPLNADVQKEYKRYHIDIINIIYIYICIMTI